MRALRILSVGLSVIFVVWTVEFVLTYNHWREPPEVLGTGNAFEGNTQLPATEIKKAVDEARSRMIEINQRGRWFTLAGDISAWLTFGCTSAVTLIAGWLGRSPGAGGAAPDTGGLPPGPTRAISLLAASAAVLTAGGTMATDRGHTQFDNAKQAQALVNQSVKDVSEAKTADEARAVLDGLKLKIDQL
jgi:hypothetical protein